MKIEIINKSSRRVPRAFLTSYLNDVFKELRRRKVFRAHSRMEMTLVFLDSTEARKINKSYRGKNYPTDVLSFAPRGPEFAGEGGSLGELVLCPEVINRQARENVHSYRDELAYMTLHGILHLLGYDHEKSDTEAKKMYRLQDAIYHKLGF